MLYSGVTDVTDDFTISRTSDSTSLQVYQVILLVLQVETTRLVVRLCTIISIKCQSRGLQGDDGTDGTLRTRDGTGSLDETM